MTMRNVERNRKSPLLCGFAFYLVWASGAQAAVQIQAFDFSNNGSAWTKTIHDAGLAVTYGLGGDVTRVGYASSYNKTGYATFWQRVSLPAGTVMSNLHLQAKLSGFSNWQMSGRIGLSITPTTSVTGGTCWTGVDKIGGSFDNTSVTLDASNIVEFASVNSVWVGVEIWKGLSSVYVRPDVSQVKLMGDLTVLPTVPGPREPLTYRNSGLYCGWTGYFLQFDTPFDFFVVTAVAYDGDNQSNANWNMWLSNARQVGKRIIADLIPQARDGGGNWYGIADLTSSSDNASMDKLAAVVDQFFTQVNINDLYAITLGEEHIFWNGGSDHLNYMYDKIKANHNVPIYQWYSPSSMGSIAGMNWPNLHSDGWMADEYFLYQQFPPIPPNPPGLESVAPADLPAYEYAMERDMRGFRILQKPVIQIMWAGGNFTGATFNTTRFSGQHEVCRKYNIPAGYFTYEGSGGYWGFEPDTPDNTTSRQIFNNYVVPAANNAKTCEIPDVQTWDNVSWNPAVIQLAPFVSSSPSSSFSEQFAVSRRLELAGDVDFVNSAACAGFADLYWDSSAVQLRPRQTGPAQSSITYTFESPFNIGEITVSAAGSVASGAVVSATVINSSGNITLTSNMTAQGNLSLTVPGSYLDGQQFKVVFSLSGTAQNAGDVLAGINSFNVVATPYTVHHQLIKSFDFSNNGSAWTVTIHDAGLPVAYGLGGDITKVGYASNTTSTGYATLWQQVSLPTGSTMANLRLAANISGYSSWAMLGRIGLSTARTTYVTTGTSWTGVDSGGAFDNAPIVLDASSISSLTNVRTVWVGVEIYKGLSWVYSRPDVSQIKLYADLSGSATVTGKVVLNGFSGSYAGYLTVELRGTFTQHFDNVPMGSDGSFTIAGVVPGTYTLWIKAPRGLAKATGGVVISSSGSTNIGTTTLTNGDCDGDNTIDSADLAMLLTAIDNSVSGNNPTDLDGDSTVTSADLSILLMNITLQGDL